ncbi:ABC transporter system ATP-binding protein EcsA [Clostridium aceticum]|uniref:ABC transporter system ATP-binding protein EcsA n=1 Tax=Clostridium aceticum TaxID=84022 RepID=A0A0G3W8I8_9CLOT|nr:ABC transporter ATP-binding protein [Clostridium aceticum]AKL94673.1 ABC transporter system ATP-binding protein EcsA [Clostridium aceticum]
MNLLELKSVSAGYDSEVILKQVSFNVQNEEIVGLIGPNGAGKTTIIKSILGILPILSGEVIIDGVSIKKSLSQMNEKIAYIPEIPLLYDELTLLEHLEFTAMSHGVNPEVFEERKKQLLKTFWLEDKQHHFPNAFSKGMRQKVMIMCAFLYAPSIYIVDEPFVGLDPKAIRAFIDMIQHKKNEGAGVLMCTHVLDTAEKICDRFILFNQGKVVTLGTLEALRKQTNLPQGSLSDIYDQLVEDQA